MDFGLHFNGWELAFLAATATIGGFMRGFAGFATTLIMVPLFALLIEPAEAVFIGVTIDVMATVALVPRAVRDAEWRPIIPLLTASILVIPLGAYILVTAPVPAMRIAIAGMVIISALLLLSGWRYRGPKTTLLSATVGAVSGTLGTATGVGGPFLAVYFLASDSASRAVRASLNSMGFIKMSLSAVAIGYAGGFGWPTYKLIVLLLPVILIFTWAGARVYIGVSERNFRLALNWVLMIVGIAIMLRAILMP